jgi:hypothetical protein
MATKLDAELITARHIAQLKDLSKYRPTPEDQAVVAWPVYRTEPKRVGNDTKIVFTIKAQVVEKVWTEEELAAAKTAKEAEEKEKAKEAAGAATNKEAPGSQGDTTEDAAAGTGKLGDREPENVEAELGTKSETRAEKSESIPANPVESREVSRDEL